MKIIMKIIVMIMPFIIASLAFNLSYAQNEIENIPVLKYAHPHSTVIMFFNLDGLVKKGLSWNGVKGLSGKFTGEAVIKKAIENPSEIGLNPFQRGLMFVVLTNSNQTLLSGLIFPLNDSSKLENFIKEQSGASNSMAIKKTNDFNFIETDSGIMGWTGGAVIILSSDIDGINLQDEMSELFANESNTNFISRTGIKRLMEKPSDLSLWFSLKSLLNGSINGLEDINSASEAAINFQFYSGKAVINVDIIGLNTNGYNDALSKKKAGPNLFNSLPGNKLIGFLSIDADMKILNETNQISSEFIKGLDKNLSILGIDKEDIIAALSGDFLFFATDIGRKKSDIEPGLTAVVRDKGKMNLMIGKLLKSKALAKDKKYKNVYIIENGPDKKANKVSGNTYIVIKNDRIYFATAPLKDFLVSKNNIKPAVRTELLNFARENTAAGYVDMTTLIKKITENGKGDSAFIAALIGNFFTDIRMTFNRTESDTANLRLEFNLTDNSENSLKLILEKIGSYKKDSN